MRWFYPYRSFKHSKWWRHELGHNRIVNTDLLYSYTNFVVEIDDKSSRNGGFLYDLMMSRDSGLIFWATL